MLRRLTVLLFAISAAYACGRDGCANLELDEGEVFTVNLQRVYGPPRLQVFDDAGQRREDLEID